MEITLNIGDNITIPENCEVVVNNNILTIKEVNFKDGDILHSKYNASQIVIFSNYIERDNGKGLFNSYFNSMDNSNTAWVTANFRHATEEEKQKFSKDLNSKGLYWDPKSKKMIKIRKRVKKHEKYLIINSLGKVVEITDEYDRFDNESLALGNYYLLCDRAQAEKDAKEIRKVYEKRFKI